MLKELRTRSSLPAPSPPDSPQSAPCQCLVHQSAPCQCLVHRTVLSLPLVSAWSTSVLLVSAWSTSLLFVSAWSTCLLLVSAWSACSLLNTTAFSLVHGSPAADTPATHHSVQSQCKRNAAYFKTGLTTRAQKWQTKVQSAAAEIKYVFTGHHCNVRCE